MAAALLRVLAERRRPALWAAAIAVALSAAWLLAAGEVSAQVGNPCAGDGINSRECICHNVDSFAVTPMKMTVDFDIDGDGVVPDAYDGTRARTTTGRAEFDEFSGQWVSDDDSKPLDLAPWGEEAEEPANPAGTTVQDSDRPAYDAVLVTNDRYNELCAFSYFRENLGRIWRFGVVLGGIAAAISLAWAGVAYMQDSASVGDAMRVRMAMLRVIMGLAVLALALVIWNVMDSYLISHVDSWSWEQDFYDFRGLHGGSER